MHKCVRLRVFNARAVKAPHAASANNDDKIIIKKKLVRRAKMSNLEGEVAAIRRARCSYYFYTLGTRTAGVVGLDCIASRAR